MKTASSRDQNRVECAAGLQLWSAVRRDRSACWCGRACGWKRYRVVCRSLGMGSFTGVRVGLAAVKGLAGSRRQACCGIVESRSFGGIRAIGDASGSDRRAHRGEVYAALYDGAGNQIVREMVGPVLGRFLARLPEGEIEWITTADLRLPAGSRRVGQRRKRIAGAIARIAIRRAASGLEHGPRSHRRELCAAFRRRDPVERNPEGSLEP